MTQRVRSEPQWMLEFLSTVYPVLTDLAVTMAHSERQILTDATAVIRDARSRIAALEKALRDLATAIREEPESYYAKPGTQEFTVHLACVLDEAARVLGEGE